MHLDAIDLKDFYASPLGAVVRRLLGARIRARWSNLQGKSLFGARLRHALSRRLPQ